MTCVVIIAVYKVSIFSAVFHGIMLTFIMGLSELLVTALIPNIYILFYRELNTLNDNSVFYVILSKTVYLFILKISSKNYNFYCIYFSTIFAEVK